MAELIKRMKELKPEDIFKGLVKTTSAAKTAYGADGDGATQPLTWYLVDRTTSQWNTDDLKNLFMSFGIAREDSASTYDRNFQWADIYRAEKILIASIPQSGVGTYIDGATLTINVPTGKTADEYFTFYGASYRGYIDPTTRYEVSQSHDDKSLHGSSTVYLFPNSTDLGADNWGEHPYTGSIDGELNPNSGLSSWTSANLNNATFYPHLRATHWTRNPDDGRDVPYGIAFLEKGLFVFFDMPGRTDFVNTYITGQTIWNSSGATFAAVTYTGGTAEPGFWTNRNNIIFTGSVANTNASVSYRTITESYKLIYFCHGAQGEFNSTSNHTYNHRKAFYQPDEADSIYITEIGLYDDNDDLLAYAKLSEPVEKTRLETLTLKVELNI